jgi:hypothetical protein
VNAIEQHQPDGRECEQNNVCAWRHAQLVRSGFPELLAARAARDERYDLHGLLELAENGCPPELALRILAPLEDRELHGTRRAAAA